MFDFWHESFKRKVYTRGRQFRLKIFFRSFFRISEFSKKKLNCFNIDLSPFLNFFFPVTKALISPIKVLIFEILPDVSFEEPFKITLASGF